MNQRYLCGVPMDSCRGAFTQTNFSLRAMNKTHASREEARKCFCHYLQTKHGYTKLSNKEMKDPVTGMVTLLNKAKTFGGVLRKGKSGERSGGPSSRFVPKCPGKRAGAGIIIDSA